MDTLSERAKLSLLSFLLLLILGLLAFTAVRTFQAVHNFQYQYSAVKAGDVSTIRPWMTIHVISHVCHVPENYLYHSLTVDNSAQFRHATLYDIANNKRQPVDQVIRTAQHAILAYRKHYPRFVTLALTQHIGRGPLSAMPGRTIY